MPNFLDFLRMHNIFGPQVPIGNDLPSQGGITGTMPRDTTTMFPAAPQAPQPPDSPNFDVDQYINEHYQPEHEASDKFTALMNAYPKREDYKPSLLRKIGASLAAVGSGYSHQDPRVKGFQFNPLGVKMGRDIMDEPFNEAQEDWAKQIVPAQAAANLERYSNANARQLATQSASDVLKLREQNWKDENAKARISIADYKARHPGIKFDFRGPTVMAGYPDGHVEDTGVKTGHLGDQDKIDANTESKLQVVGAQGANQQATAETKANAPFVITDPTDPTKQIAVKYNPVSNKMERVEFEGQTVHGMEKVGTPGKGGTGQPDPQAMEGLKQKAQETLDEIKTLLDDKGELTSTGRSTTGYGGAISGHVLGTGSYIGHKSVQRIKDLLTLEIIQEMKNQSKTGATGFGRMTNMEVGILSSAAAKLDPGMGNEAMKKELARIREKLQKVLQPTSGFESDATKVKSTSDLDSQADALIAKHSGVGQ